MFLYDNLRLGSNIGLSRFLQTGFVLDCGRRIFRSLKSPRKNKKEQGSEPQRFKAL